MKDDLKTMLFQAVMFDLFNLIIPLFLYSGYVLIIIGGAMYLKREEIVERSILFVIIGAVEIIYQFIAYRIYALIDEIIGLGFDEYIFFISVIPNIISIITFGILIIILGKLNSVNSGNFLLISGILWTIYAVTMLMLNLFIPPGLWEFVIMIQLIIFILMIVARIFFVIYSAKIGESVFLVASIFLLISSATNIISWIIFTLMP